MAKIFETREEIIEMVADAFDKAGLTNYGLNLRVMSLTKAKDVIKVTKANATTEFLTKKDSIIQVFIYEAAFDRLDDNAKRLLIEMALTNVSVDIEKGKVNIETNPFVQVFNMARKYGNGFLNTLEYSYAAIKQIEEEAEAEKENNKRKKKEE